ncbi:hypothetical protein [Cohnella zeiphila]|uniref:Uncharacterized protein n=1 Tax=Cohnella zeiphila TaxID=2761120 RepID=A0A7X0SSK8_9BACL|nr:hypothetical protein [Cohnella zeiphila]MBB6735206.1 hypothetical protein [Cohnella zeiphila]
MDGLRFFEESGLTTLLEETKRCLEAKGLHLESGGEYRLRLRQLFERFQNGFAAGSERVSGSIRFDPASFVRITA